MSYQVTGACAQIKYTDPSGQQVVTLLYQGAEVPDSVDKDNLEHNIAVGLVEEVGRNGEPKTSSRAPKGS